MSAYFEYLREMFVAFFQNLGKWFADPWKPVSGEFDYYNSLLSEYSKNFGGAGWFFWVLFLILLIAFIGAFCFLIFWLIRKYVRFRRDTATEEALRREVEKLNLELYQAIAEKDRVLGLNVAAFGVNAPNGGDVIEGSAEEANPDESVGDVRFPRLALVDKKYENYELKTVLPEDAMNIDLKGICERFRNFAASQMGLYYTIDTIRVFFSAMGTGKIIILEGISGTGKTSLPYALGRFFKHNASICSVQPSWRDRSELLGYYNDFTHKFTETQFLHSIYEATFRDDISLVVLDEMNLARIEYYFAEFLSIMEMPNVAEWNISLVAAPQPDDPAHVKDGRLLIPQNIWFIGTANNDDSTFTITDKVYDRAMSLFFDNKGIAFKAPFTEALPLPVDYIQSLFKQAKEDFPLSQKTLEKFQELDSFVIEHFKLAFGNRIMKQLNDFVPCYIACGGTELEAVDYMFQSKILKKFEVLNVAFLRDELIALDSYLTKQFGKGEFLLSHKKIKGLIKMSA